MTEGQATQGALVALAGALAVGEGLAWAAVAALLGVQLAVPSTRGTARAQDPWPPGAAGLALVIGAGAFAWLGGGYGCLRPAALAHWAPLVAWPLAARASRVAGAQAVGRALVWGLGALGVAIAYSAYQMAGHNVGAAEAWVRLDTLAGEQNLTPGGQGAAMGGLYHHRLKMAHGLLIALGPLAARQLIAPLSLRRRAGEGLMAALLVGALALTYARAAYVGAAAGSMALALGVGWQLPTARRRLAYLALLVTVGLGLGICVAPGVRARLVSSQSADAAQVRGIIWSQAVRIVAEHPLGVGLGNYPHVVGRYYAAADPLTPSPRTYPHSLLWGAWAEAGPLGALGMMIFWLAPWAAAWAYLGRLGAKAAPSAGGRAFVGAPDSQAAAAWLFIGMSLFTVGLTHDVLFHNIVALAFAAALGTCQGLMHDAEALR